MPTLRLPSPSFRTSILLPLALSGVFAFALPYGCGPTVATPPEVAVALSGTPPPPAAAPASSDMPPASPSSVQAEHRSGQTILTWKDDTASEWVALYRLAPGQTPSGGQTPLAILGQDACATPRQAALPALPLPISQQSKPMPQQRLILTPLGPELPAGWSCYVHTPRLSQEEAVIYWLLPWSSSGSTPSKAHTRSVRVVERPGSPQPVLIQDSPGGRRKLYTQLVDDGLPRSARDGVAFNFWVGLPPGKPPASGWPLTIHLHAWGESWQRFYQSSPSAAPGTPYDLPMVWLELDDPSNTWWTGSVAPPPFQPHAPARATLHTEARVMAVIDWLLSPAAGVPIDANRITLYGGSMGGTGALALSLHHPARFAAVYAQLPLTRPAASEWGKPGFQALFGNPLDPPRLPNGKSLYEYLDLVQTLQEVSDGDRPFTVTVHGRGDRIVEWATQGVPWIQAASKLGRPGPALFAEGDHSSVFDSFTAGLVRNFRPSEGHFRRTEAYPVFSRLSVDDGLESPIPSCRNPDPLYRYGYVGGGIQWSGQGVAVLGQLAPEETDKTLRIGLQLRSDLCNLPKEGTTDITFYRLQRLKPAAGAQLAWEVKDARGGLRGSGRGTWEKDRIRLEGVPITQEGVSLQLRAY